MSRKGGAMPGAGRPKGSRNKRTLELQQRVAQSGLTPLDYMLSIVRDEKREDAIRLEAAKSAAPYVHPRLNSIELKADVEVRRVVKREPLSADEWAKRHDAELPTRH
jgi:hypothetical protein